MFEVVLIFVGVAGWLAFVIERSLREKQEKENFTLRCLNDRLLREKVLRLWARGETDWR
jgi:hypothetical protein